MPFAQTAQVLPSFELSLQPDHHRAILPNISYPSRSNTHIPWSGSSAPLFFVKTTRPQMEIATSNPIVQAPTTANLDTSSVPDTFQGISVLIWHSLSMIIQKLRLIPQRFFGIGFTSRSATASV